MIFLDANFFLRAVAEPTSPETARMQRIAADLFQRASRGEVELTTSDAVIAEVAFILTSTNVYALPPAAAAAGYLIAILNSRGFKLSEKRTILDALTAAYAQRPGMERATFDTDFNTLPGINRWQPLVNPGT